MLSCRVTMSRWHEPVAADLRSLQTTTGFSCYSYRRSFEYCAGATISTTYAGTHGAPVYGTRPRCSASDTSTMSVAPAIYPRALQSHEFRLLRLSSSAVVSRSTFKKMTETTFSKHGVEVQCPFSHVLDLPQHSGLQEMFLDYLPSFDLASAETGDGVPSMVCRELRMTDYFTGFAGPREGTSFTVLGMSWGCMGALIWSAFYKYAVG